MVEEHQKKCARCESNKPAKTYDPRIIGKPNKTVNLCDECAIRDPKAVPIDNVVPEIEPAVPEEHVECKVTAVDPEDPSKGNRPVDEDFATKEYGPGNPEPISIPTPKSAPDVTEKPHPMLCVQHGGSPTGEQTNKVCGFTCPKCENKPVSTEPIERQGIRDKVAVCEKDLDSLLESRQRILAQFEKVKTQLNQCNAMINARKIEVASYRGILGNEG